MKLTDLAKKASDLQYLKFDWPGKEQFTQEVFEREVKDLPSVIAYVDNLRKRVGEQSYALHEMAQAFNKLSDLILEAEVGEE